MEMWMVGLALTALLAVAARDVGRAGTASGPGLLCLRGVGGVGLAAMALVALRGGHPEAALVAALGAAPLAGSLVSAAHGWRERRRVEMVRETRARGESIPAMAAAVERQAA